jgi:hypothetical protein
LKHKDAERVLEERWFLAKDRDWNLKSLDEWIE